MNGTVDFLPKCFGRAWNKSAAYSLASSMETEGESEIIYVLSFLTAKGCDLMVQSTPPIMFLQPLSYTLSLNMMEK